MENEYVILQAHHEALIAKYSKLKSVVRTLIAELAVAVEESAPSKDAGVQRPGEDGW